jgi:hypothetical protein
MASDFPIGYYTGTERGPMNEMYTPDAAAVITPGDLVVMEGDEEIVECATDAVSILGIAKSSSADKFLYQNRVLVQPVVPQVEYGLCVGAGTLASTHANTAVGVQKLASGNWGVDLAEVTAQAFLIIRVDVPNQIAWGKFLAAVCQFDGVAS